MTEPLRPITPVLPVSVPTGQAQVAAGALAAVPAAALPAAGQVQPTPAAPVTSSVQWSAQTLQNLKLQAFEHLIAQLALQIQGSPGAPAATWPTQGLPAATQQFLQNLLAQIQVTVQGQTQPLQLLAGQQGSVALMQALVQAASAQSGSTSPSVIPPSSALQTAAALSPTAAAALEQAGRSPADATTAPRLPLLQNWLVQQGTLVTPQGERGFSLTLQVPAAWAQAVGGAAPSPSLSPSASPAQGMAPMRLPVAELSALSSGPLALVLQPQGPAAGATSGLATSALLWLELQPISAAAAQSTPAQLAGLPLAMPAPALAQEVQQLLQNKSDPWLMMAAAQAANALPMPRRNSEHRSHLCMTEGCQYQGLAPCAQPFCSEMNRIWTSSRMAAPA
ncbi:Fe-S oxidoreductase [Comamonas suwonensis]|uniref:Fe-S oxidoreductase n=1 Tax=Comamonas suwonensis TaxID=2606214 RepID=UPI00145CAC73|nr:Fe-S oxidoreductase [Comamonas suwonensis]MBI1623249.1 Fe-S oxidoreductase [Comamonas suwonensis]